MTISSENWEKLAVSLQKEPAIMGYRNVAKKLESLYLQGFAVIRQDRAGEIVTFGGLWSTPVARCLEAGSFWVHPSHRDKKHASWMFEKLSEKIPARYVAMCVTHVEKVAHLLLKAGWLEATRDNWHNTVPFPASCGPCDVVTEDEKATCPYRATKDFCRMFWKLG